MRPVTGEVHPETMSSFDSMESERLFNFLTKNGKCHNLQQLLANMGKSAPELLNRIIQPQVYPIHIVALRIVFLLRKYFLKM